MVSDEQYKKALYELELNNLSRFDYIAKEKFKGKKLYIDFFKNKVIKYFQNQKYEKTIQNKPEENMDKEELKNCLFTNLKGKKIAVYSCITKKYDKVVEPSFQHESIDYYMFSEEKIYSKYWVQKKIPNDILKKYQNPILINRYIKLHPFEFFADYDYVFYIDGNVGVISDLSGLVKKIPDEGIAMHKHSERMCIYKEAEAILVRKRGNAEAIKNQIERYKSMKYPENYGLVEATIILSSPKNNICKKIFNEWWNEFKDSDSMRDQLSLPYVLWKNKIEIDKITTLGNNIRKSSKFSIKNHV